MNNTLLKYIVILSLIVLLVGSGAESYNQEQLQADLDAIVAQGAVGAQARVTIGDEVFVATSGVADLQSREPVPADGYYRIGSTTKTFVATVILQLVDEGKLSLDDSLAQHLSNVIIGNGYDDTAITVRDLLQHTSGIFDYNMDEVWFPFAEQVVFEARRYEQYEPEELVAVAVAHRPKFPPGDGYSYANTNYIVAGLLIETVTGNNWTSEVERRIIEPLNLQHTFIPDDAQMPSPHAKGYYQFEPNQPLVDVTLLDPSAGGAGGAIVSNSADITRFFSALLGGELLSSQQLQQMKTTIPEMEGRYGLGLGWSPLPCGDGYWRHGGAVPGYLSYEGFSDDGSLGVVLSVSSWRVDAGGVAQDEAARSLINNVFCGD